MEQNNEIKNYKGELIKLDSELIKNITLEYNILLKREFNRKVTYEELLCIIKKIYSIIDKYCHEISKYSPCKKGCSLCCNMLVVPSKLEIDLIYHYLINNFDLNKIKSFEKKIETTLPYVPKGDLILHKSKDSFINFNKYYLMEQKCAFLSDCGTCEIYPVRPFSCRTFYVISESSQCKPSSDNIYIEYKLRIVDEMKNLIRNLNNIVESTVGEEIHVFASIPEHFQFGINELSTSFNKISKGFKFNL